MTNKEHVQHLRIKSVRIRYFNSVASLRNCIPFATRGPLKDFAVGPGWISFLVQAIGIPSL